MMLNKDKRQRWMKKVKPGDDVCFREYRYGNVRDLSGKVKSISLSGEITINGLLFNEYGEAYGMYFSYVLIGPTKEVQEKLISFIKKVSLKSLTVDQLREIVDIIKIAKGGLMDV